jgi:hypothetical protein
MFRRNARSTSAEAYVDRLAQEIRHKREAVSSALVETMASQEAPSGRVYRAFASFQGDFDYGKVAAALNEA